MCRDRGGWCGGLHWSGQGLWFYLQVGGNEKWQWKVLVTLESVGDRGKCYLCDNRKYQWQRKGPVTEESVSDRGKCRWWRKVSVTEESVCVRGKCQCHMKASVIEKSVNCLRKVTAGGKWSEPKPKFHIHQLCELQNLRTTRILSVPKPYKKHGKLIFEMEKFVEGWFIIVLLLFPCEGGLAFKLCDDTSCTNFTAL